MIATLACNGLTLGGTDYLIKRHSGFDFPITRITAKDRGNYSGAILGAYNYGRRLFGIEGEIWASTPAELETKRRDMQRAFDILNGLQRVTITTRGGLAVRCDAILNNKLEQPYEAGMMVMCPFRLEMVVPYPFFLTTAVSSNIYIATGGGGAVPSEIPFDMSGGLTSNENITNNGNAPSYPTIKLYGIMNNPVIKNATTGLQLSVAYNLTTIDDYITLDIYRRTAKLNNNTNVFQYISGNWWTLREGQNTITLSAETYGSGARAVITYQDHYLGL